MDLYNTRDRTQDIQDVKTKSKILQDIQDPRSYQDFQVPISCQHIQDQIEDLTKKFKILKISRFSRDLDKIFKMSNAG